MPEQTPVTDFSQFGTPAAAPVAAVVNSPLVNPVTPGTPPIPEVVSQPKQKSSNGCLKVMVILAILAVVLTGGLLGGALILPRLGINLPFGGTTSTSSSNSLTSSESSNSTIASTTTSTPPVASTVPDKIWQVLDSFQLSNKCEKAKYDQDQRDPAIALKLYPAIQLPAKGKWLVVDSIRNLIASDRAVDILDSEGAIVFTIDKLGDYDFNPMNPDLIVFKGVVAQNDCTTPIAAIFDLKNRKLTKLDASGYDLKSDQTTSVEFKWSQDGQHVTMGQQTTSVVPAYRLSIFSLSGAKVQAAVELKDPQFDNFQELCVTVCTGPEVEYNAESKVLNLVTGDSQSTTWYKYTFSLQGKLTDTGTITITPPNPTCASVEYTAGGTTTFCQY